MQMSTYVVFKGRAPGIYNSWNLCQSKVKGYPNAIYCKFDNLADAERAYNKFTAEERWCLEVRFIHCGV